VLFIEYDGVIQVFSLAYTLPIFKICIFIIKITHLLRRINMIRLKHILAEIGEGNATPYPFQMYNGEAYFETAGGTMYQVTFPYGSDEIMEISFAVKGIDGRFEHDIETAESDVYRVMSTIVEIAKRAVEKLHPTQIVFGVAKSDPRRMRLYRAYVMRGLPAYEVTAETASFLELTRRAKRGFFDRFDWTGIKDK
jgi:hypothetical protein